MGKWLEGNVDWALSRERYWGTPLPVWRCTADGEHVHCVGSRAELSELGAAPPDDLHRPFVDEVTFPCPDCGAEMRRVPELIDVWWDSGCMPFAQWHAPFENQEIFEQRFPADYICEGLDQTRGWFYSLLAISTMLFGRSSYETVLCLGLILDPEGQKMSKSRGNIVDPWDVLNHHGADAFRWYYFTSKQPWDGYRFSVDTVGESVRLFLQAALEHVRLLRPLRERQRRRAPAGVRLQPDPRSTAGRSHASMRRRRRSSSGWRTTTRRPPAARSRRSSTTFRTGTSAVRGAGSGTATRAPSGRCASAS